MNATTSSCVSKMSNLRSAMKLYQQNGDPTASLQECQKVWNNQSSIETIANDQQSAPANTNADSSSSNINNAQSVSRQHNEAILQNLSAQRQRSRRVRRRPSSFDENNNNSSQSAECNNIDNNNTTNSNDSSKAATTAAGGDDKRNISGEGQSNTTTAGAANINETGGGDLITVLNDILASLSVHQQHQPVDSPPNSGRQLNNNNTEQIQEVVTAYNLSLAHYAQGEYTTALGKLGGVLSRWMDMVTVINTKSGSISGDGGKEKNGGKLDGEETMVVQIQQQHTDGSSNDNKVLQFPLHSNHATSIMSILTRVTFLYLDCALNIHVGNGRGFLGTRDDDVDLQQGEGETNDAATTKQKVSVQDVLGWVENVILVYTKQRAKTVDDDDVLTADEVKFKLHLYKSRVLLQGTPRGTISSGKQQEQQQMMDGETRARLARKELKNAMDIYQNKLCVSVEDGGGSEGKGTHGEKDKKRGGAGGGDKHRGGGKGNHHQDTSETTSISGSLVTSASDALWNEGKGGVVARATFEGMPNNKQQQQQQTATVTSSSTTPAANKVKVKKDTPGLHVRHESVLYMKANLEYMRGNTTKSLKLCAEARTSGQKSRVKSNNGVAAGQIGEENGFSHNDDVAVANGNKTDTTTTTEEEDLETQMANAYDEAIYYNNLAMVHQSAGKIHVASHYYSYAISYMENVKLPNDNYFWSDGVPRPNITADIFNNASLCAFQAHDYKRAYECMVHCVTLSPSIFGERARCWLRMAQSLIGIHANQQWTNSSNNSIELTNDASLLECTLGSEEDLLNISINALPRISSCLEKAQNLSSGQDAEADLDCFEAATLSLAYVKLELKDAAGALEMCRVILGSDDIMAIAKEDRSSYTSESLRRRAMARVYACEAFCRLGDPNSALFIVESESSLQCLASDISASSSKQHDAYAQFATRATASGTFSSTGSFDRAKLHASMTTRVAENLTADKIDNVFEKRVHLFSRLKEGDTDGAIAILRAMGKV